MDSKGAQAGGICSLVNNSDVHGVEALLTLWHADGVIEKHSLPETSFRIQLAQNELQNKRTCSHLRLCYEPHSSACCR